MVQPLKEVQHVVQIDRLPAVDLILRPGQIIEQKLQHQRAAQAATFQLEIGKTQLQLALPDVRSADDPVVFHRLVKAVALLRAVGDTRRPLYCLAVSGVINVVLNLVFVILFQMSVAGVALATIISQTVSALMVTVLLMKEEGPLHLDLRHLGFHKGALVQILKIGLPAGLQSTVFSLSNVVIQSAVNSFGSTIVAGNSAASNIEGFIYTGMNAFAQAAVTFTSQNVGARRYDNLDRVMRNCLLCAVVVGIVLGGGAYLAGEGLLHFYSTDETVVAAGLARMKVICTSYFLCGIMDTLASCLRGRGYSVLPMIVSLVGSCLLRLVWIATIFQLFRSTTTLYISYPISWLLTASVHLACLLVVRHKMNNAGQPAKIAA